jgi:chromosome segregation ATPase
MSEETTKNFGDEESFEARVLSLLMALRGDVAGLQREVTGLQNDMAGLKGSVRVIDGRLTAIEGRAASLELQVRALDEKVDARLRDTRPIWESVLSKLKMIDTKFDLHSHDMLELRAEMELIKQRVPPVA